MLTSEIESQQATIRPLVDNMLECRKRGIEQMNKLFNGNTQVELDSVWNNIKEKQELESPVSHETNSNSESNSEAEKEADKESNDKE